MKWQLGKRGGVGTSVNGFGLTHADKKTLATSVNAPQNASALR
jgi:hypothetical protein